MNRATSRPPLAAISLIGSGCAAASGSFTLAGQIPAARAEPSRATPIEEARQNLREAVELFLETADPPEIADRLRSEISPEVEVRT